MEQGNESILVFITKKSYLEFATSNKSVAIVSLCLGYLAYHQDSKHGLCLPTT